jgi:hypothetical protein
MYRYLDDDAVGAPLQLACLELVALVLWKRQNNVTLMRKGFGTIYSSIGNKQLLVCIIGRY